MNGIVARNNELHREGKNIGSEPSVANREDWFSDSVFAQQSFTGPNPTSIKTAPATWVKEFIAAADKQGNKKFLSQLESSTKESLYIQDYSYFRAAIGAKPDSTLSSDDGKRFGCAAVTLFQLSTSGNLHPLAIVIDYKGSMDASVVIFNQRTKDTDSTAGEKDDWPWRYAKMCNQVSDWTKHEMAVHLNDCHFVEEATIVAASRSFPSSHVVYGLLEPHW